jgi:hypothetical protein
MEAYEFREFCEHGHHMCSETPGGRCSCEDWDARAWTIARNFQAIISDRLSPGQLAQMRALNAAEPSFSVCHSHDFLDANEAMREAFARAGEDLESDGGFWCVAWDLSLDFLGR